MVATTAMKDVRIRMIGKSSALRKTISASTSPDATLPPAARPRMAIKVQVTRIENSTVKVAPAALANSRCRERRKIIQ